MALRHFELWLPLQGICGNNLKMKDRYVEFLEALIVIIHCNMKHLMALNVERVKHCLHTKTRKRPRSVVVSGRNSAEGFPLVGWTLLHWPLVHLQLFMMS